MLFSQVTFEFRLYLSHIHLYLNIGKNVFFIHLKMELLTQMIKKIYNSLYVIWKVEI